MRKIFNDKFKEKWGGLWSWVIAIIWAALYWEGHRFLPGARWLSEVIPLWAAILNLACLFISFTLLVVGSMFFSSKGALSPYSSFVILIVLLIVILFSMVLVHIGYERFPLITTIVAGGTLLLNLGLIMWGKRRG